MLVQRADSAYSIREQLLLQEFRRVQLVTQGGTSVRVKARTSTQKNQQQKNSLSWGKMLVKRLRARL